MHLAVIDVKIQAAVCFQHALRLDQTRLEEAQVIIELVVVGAPAQRDGAVAAPLEAHPVAILLVAHGLDLRARLHPSGIERRIDVDQINGFGGQRLQYGQIVSEEDAAGHADILSQLLENNSQSRFWCKKPWANNIFNP